VQIAKRLDAYRAAFWFFWEATHAQFFSKEKGKNLVNGENRRVEGLKRAGVLPPKTCFSSFLRAISL